MLTIGVIGTFVLGRGIIQWAAQSGAIVLAYPAVPCSTFRLPRPSSTRCFCSRQPKETVMHSMSIENADSKPFWEGARSGRLLMQQCGSCRHIQFPPRHLCAKCWSVDLAWTECSGRGTVESFTIVHRAPTPEMRGKVPYVVAAILLDEGPRMMTNIVGADPLGVRIDDRVTVTFVPDDHGRVLPQFQRIGR